MIGVNLRVYPLAHIYQDGICIRYSGYKGQTQRPTPIPLLREVTISDKFRGYVRTSNKNLDQF